MEFVIGQKVKYYFPIPKNLSKPYFIGEIENVLENHLILKNQDNVMLKVSFANYDLLKPFNPFTDTPSQITENFVG